MNTNLTEREQIPAAWLESHLTDLSAQGIASGVHRLIKDGLIARGSQLPTVRALAARLHVSPATVSSAWNILRRQRVIEGAGRQGTWVIDGPYKLGPPRYEDVNKHWKNDVLDLAFATPDPLLLPDLVTAIQKAPRDPALNSYARQSITPALEHAVRQCWPWKAERLIAVNGGYDGLLLVLRAIVVPGDRVAVADPSSPRTLDILEHIGARAVPVSVDANGPRGDSLRAALERRPVAFLYEPRASSRFGTSMSEQRRDLIADVLDRTDTFVIEDDGIGDLAQDPYSGLGPIYPHRTVLIRSYSKSYGPDLRLAVVGGAEEPVTRAHDLRQFGDGWSSRLNQNALAWMLEDLPTQNLVKRARATYRTRRERITKLFADRGIVVDTPDGLALNVPTSNEHHTLLALASHGIATSGASGSAIRALVPMVRLSVGRELDDPDGVVDAYARAIMM